MEFMAAREGASSARRRQASNACTLSKFHKIECEAVNVQHSETNKPFHQNFQMSMFK